MVSMLMLEVIFEARDWIERASSKISRPNEFPDIEFLGKG
jgi:hypothetical protein